MSRSFLAGKRDVARGRHFLGAALSILTFYGCDSGPSMPIEEARQAVVLEAAGAELKGDAVERWLAAGGTQPDETMLNILVSVWIDEALFATALAAGDRMNDSATVDAAMAPVAATNAIARHFQERQARVPEPTEEQLDSLVDTGDVRVFQQILLSVPAGEQPTVEKQRQAQLLQRRAIAGEDFSALVREASDDTAARANAGMLPAVTQAELPPALAGRLWPISAGQVVVVPSAVGIHILRRATPAESRSGLRTWLHQALIRSANMAYTDSLFTSRNIALGPDAVTRVRQSIREPVSAPEGEPLVSWQGGTLTPEEARIQLLMYTGANRAAFYAASDSDRATLVYELARRQIMTDVVAPQGALTPAARAEMTPQFLQSLNSTIEARTRFGNLPPAELASAVVDAAIGGSLQHGPLPGALGAVLRARHPVRVNRDALDAILAAAVSAWQARALTDSTAPAPQPPQQP